MNTIRRNPAQLPREEKRDLSSSTSTETLDETRAALRLSREKRIVVLVLLLLLLGDGVWAVFSLWQSSALYLHRLQERTSQAEMRDQAVLAGRLTLLSHVDEAKLVEASLSTEVIAQLVRQLDGIEFSATPEISVRLDELRAEFSDGFPKVRVTGHAAYGGQTVQVAAAVVLRPEMRTHEVVLHPYCIDLVPTSDYLPRWATTIAAAQTAQRANTEFDRHPIVVPLQEKVEIPFDRPAAIPLAIKTDNGTIHIRLDLPQPPPVQRWVHPREVFVSRDALHVVIELLDSAAADPATQELPKASDAVDAKQLDALLAPWRLAPGLGFEMRVGREALLSLLALPNQWTPAQRTLTAQGISEDGSIKETTGGLPFGNGYRAYLDGPDRLRASVSLDNFRPAWNATEKQIRLAVEATAQAEGQLQVHGNAPHIQPEVFGVKIGGGVTLGGGAGTSVGVSTDATKVTLTAAVQLNSDTGKFDVLLLDPADVVFHPHAGGIPDALLDLFKVGLKAPLPCGKALTSFGIPAFIAKDLEVPMPQGMGSRRLSLRVDDIKTSFGNNGLRVTAKTNIFPAQDGR